MRAVSISIFLVGLMALSAPLRAEGEKFAYVDIAKVYDNYQMTKDNDRTLQEAGRKKEEERDALVHEIRQLKDEITLLNDSAKAEKQKEIEKKIGTLQDYDQDAKMELGDQRRTIVQDIFKNIDEAVNRYGERKGIDLIFNDKSLLYQNPKYDITEDVLQELNKEYTKKK